MQTNGEISERETRRRLAREGFAMLSRAMLASYIESGRLPSPQVRSGRKYFKLSDVNYLLKGVNRLSPAPVKEPEQIKTNLPKPKTRRCFVNAGLA